MGTEGLKKKVNSRAGYLANKAKRDEYEQQIGQKRKTPPAKVVKRGLQ
jgi:hypothetical protein